MFAFFQIFKSNLVRPIIYKVIQRFVIGMVLALLWDRFLNGQKLFSMVDHVFFVLGVLFFAMAWVSYLRMDGVKIFYLNELIESKKRKTKHKMKNPTDFMEEEPAPDDTLTDKEKAAANLIANIAAGLCFMLPAVFSMLFLRP